jgi:hypothetical protein
MASIWIDQVGKKPKKYVGNLTPLNASLRVLELVKGMQTTHRIKSRNAGSMTWMLYRNGGVIGSVFIEPYSPSSKPSKGETYYSA